MINREASIALESGKYLLMIIGDVNIVINKDTSLSTIQIEYGDELDVSDFINAEYKVIGE